MSQFLKFYFTSSVLNIFRTLIHPSSGAIFLLYRHIGCVFLFRRVFEFRCGWLGWYPCGRLNPDDGCINVRNMLSTEEVK